MRAPRLAEYITKISSPRRQRPGGVRCGARGKAPKKTLELGNLEDRCPSTCLPCRATFLVYRGARVKSRDRARFARAVIQIILVIFLLVNFYRLPPFAGFPLGVVASATLSVRLNNCSVDFAFRDTLVKIHSTTVPGERSIFSRRQFPGSWIHAATVVLVWVHYLFLYYLSNSLSRLYLTM